MFFSFSTCWWFQMLNQNVWSLDKFYCVIVQIDFIKRKLNRLEFLSTFWKLKLSNTYLKIHQKCLFPAKLIQKGFLFISFYLKVHNSFLTLLLLLENHLLLELLEELKVHSVLILRLNFQFFWFFRFFFSYGFFSGSFKVGVGFGDSSGQSNLLVTLGSCFVDLRW